jgi:molybdopterin converting factor small subunit
MIPEVTVELYPWLSKALGAKSKVVLTLGIRKQETLRTLLERLALKHVGVGAMIYDINHELLHDGVVIFVNDRPIAKDLQLPLKQGDRVAVTPFYSGG